MTQDSDFQNIPDDNITLGAIRALIDYNDLPRKLPALYGENAWLVGLSAAEPTILNDPKSVVDNIGISFEINPVFYQTESQKSYTDALAAQAATGSISGLRKHVESDKFINEKATAFISTALELVMNVYLTQDETDGDVEIFYGPILQFPVKLTDGQVYEDKKVGEVLTLLESMFNMRLNTFTNALIAGVQTYSNVTNRIAETTAANFLDEESETAAPLNSEAIFEQQQKEALEKVRNTFAYATLTPRKLKEVFIPVSGLQDLLKKLRDINKNLGEDVDATSLLDFILHTIAAATELVEDPVNTRLEYSAA